MNGYLVLILLIFFFVVLNSTIEKARKSLTQEQKLVYEEIINKERPYKNILFFAALTLYIALKFKVFFMSSQLLIYLIIFLVVIIITSIFLSVEKFKNANLDLNFIKTYITAKILYVFALVSAIFAIFKGYK